MIFRTWILALALMSLPAPGQISVQVGPGNTLRLHGASEMVLGGDLDIRGDFAGEGTLTLAGGSEQQLTNTAGETVATLNIAKSGGVVHLGADLVVSQALLMNSSNILTHNNTLFLGSSSEGTLIHNNGRVVGKLGRFISTTTGSRDFPIGSDAAYRPVSVNFTAAPTTAGMLILSHSAGGVYSENIDPLSDNGYPVDRRSQMFWEMAGSSLNGGSIELSVDGQGQTGILDPASLRILHSADGSTFDLPGNHLPGSGTVARRANLPGNSSGFFYLGGNPLDNPMIEVTAATVAVRGGWNLLGLPLTVENGHYQNLFPNAVSGSLQGYANGDYFAAESLSLGAGYFLEFPQAESVALSGFPAENLTVDLEAGWNLFSSGSTPVPVDSILDPGGIILSGTIYGFNGALYPATQLESGKGYWIRATAAGQITLPATIAPFAPALAKGAPEPVADFPALTITDAGGLQRTLFLAVDYQQAAQKMGLAGAGPAHPVNKGENSGDTHLSAEALRDRVVQHFHLPPAPSGGITQLDARFEGDLATSEAAGETILLRAEHFPLTITLANSDRLTESEIEETPPAASNTGKFRYVLAALIDDRVAETFPVEGDRPIQLSDNRINRLQLRKEAVLPTRFAVYQNYPNPFNPSTEIRFDLPEDARVDIEIFNVIGQRVRTLVSGTFEAGEHRVVWQGANEAGARVASGLYFYRVVSGRHHTIKKMILLK